MNARITNLSHIEPAEATRIGLAALALGRALGGRTAAWIAAGIAAGWAFVLADAALRVGWDHISAAGHASASAGLYAAAGVVLGLVASAAMLLADGGVAALGSLGEGARRFVRVAAPAALGFACGWLSVTWALGPDLAGRALWLRMAPPIVSGAIGAVLLPVVFAWARFVVRDGRKRVAWGTGAAASLAGAALMFVDATVLVALYPRVHTLIEACAAACWLMAFRSWLVVRHARSRPLVASVAFAGLAWLVVYATPDVRNDIQGALRHTAQEQVFAGRMRHRVLLAEQCISGTARDDAALGLATTGRFASRDRKSPQEPSVWASAKPEDPGLRAAITRLRAPHAGRNVIVYYIDALRNDAASDPTIMPNVVRFRRENLDFTRAYATGSDTLSSLPAMVRGSYDLDKQDKHDLLSVAAARGLRTGLIIPTSPRAFLAKHLPSFRFDETVEVADANRDEEIWGYGAHKPTAGPMVDEALGWLRRHRNDRFMLWLHNNDVHAWRELNDGYVAERANALALPPNGELNWKYRAVARTVDAQFGRLLAGLDSLGMKDDTIVVLVADHGEGVGQQGFWVHSIFLWESLVRVPMAMRIPGVRGTVECPVSTVDFAPTIVRFMQPAATSAPYHGEDLLGALASGTVERRYPMVMRAVRKEDVIRLGVLDPSGRYKAIAPLEGGPAELYDTTRRDPDDVDIALDNPDETARLIQQLVRSPINPLAPKPPSGAEPPADDDDGGDPSAALRARMVELPYRALRQAAPPGA